MDILYGILCFLAPVGMLLMGILWKITPPPFQKSGLSYNTELTRSNLEAWETAHRHCSKLWIRIGIISGCVSGILLKLFSDSVASFWLWLIVGQMALFCVSVFMVDLLLKTQYGGEKKE